MIKLTFRCGHTLDATGNETDPHCGCGCAVIDRVDAPNPTFKGCVLGPCAQFENLPPQAVTFKKDETDARN